MKKLKEGNDLTQGNLMKNMVMLFLPLLLTNLLNSIYNFVDGIWIGGYIGHYNDVFPLGTDGAVDIQLRGCAYRKGTQTP